MPHDPAAVAQAVELLPFFRQRSDAFGDSKIWDMVSARNNACPGLEAIICGQALDTIFRMVHAALAAAVEAAAGERG